MKVIIAGGRNFTNYQVVKEYCDIILKNISEVEIVSGRCNAGDRKNITFKTEDNIEVYGADGLGERYAQENGYKVTPFPANWSMGKVAGIRRNTEMAKYADGLIAFWDGKSRGTKDMIDQANRRRLKVAVRNI